MERSDTVASSPIPSWLRSEGLLLAATPAIAYLLVYAYEQGVALHFGIPPSLVSIGVENVLRAALFAIPLLLAVVLPTNLTPPRVVVFLVNVGLLILAAFLMFRAPFPPPPGDIGFRYAIAILLGLLLITSLTQLAHELAGQPKSQTEGGGRPGVALIENDIMEASRRGLAHRSVAVRLLAGVVFLFALAVADQLGQAAAVSERRFLVSYTDSNLVVLRKYGDYYVVAKLDRTKRVIRPVLGVVPVVGDTLLLWRHDDLGPLTVER